MHDQLISSLVLRRQRQICRIIVARPANLRVLLYESGARAYPFRAFAVLVRRYDGGTNRGDNWRPRFPPDEHNRIIARA